MPWEEIAIRLAGPAIVLVGIAISAYLVYQQMKTNYEINLRSRALGYSLYANEHIRNAKIIIEKEFGPVFERNEAIPLSIIGEKIESNEELLSSILTILAHWENMALAIHSGVADNAVCYEMVGSSLDQHVKVFRSFIDKRRENNKRIYYHLMLLRREWEQSLSDIKVSHLYPVVFFERKRRKIQFKIED